MNNNSTKHHSVVEQGRPAILALLRKGQVDAADVTQLRRQIFCDRSMSRIEVEDLMGIDAVIRPDSEAWTDFFVEAVTDHLVWDVRPTGVLEEATARWLIGKVDASKTLSSFAVLVNILEEAHRVPRWFEDAVRQRAVAPWPSIAASLAQHAASFPA